MNNLKKVLIGSSILICGVMSSYVNNNYQKPTDLNLDDFECKIKTIKHSGKYIHRKEYEYFDKSNGEYICRFIFEIKPCAGKISVLGVSNKYKYKHKTLYTQMLNKVKEEVKGKTNKIWVISCSPEIVKWYENHKDDKTIKKIDGCDVGTCPKYEIYI